MINEYYLEMGCKSTLSVGIAAAKPKHPIYLLYDCADELLKIAKNNSRDLALSVREDWKCFRRDFRGSIAFYTADGNIMDRNSLKYIIKYEYEKFLSSQYKKPYTFSEVRNDRSILRLLKLIIDVCDMDNIVTKLIKLMKLLISEDKDLVRKISKIKRKILDIIQVSDHLPIEAKVVYTAKEASKDDEEAKMCRILKEFLIVKETENRSVRLRYNLLDAYNLIKILEGK
jgi:hypothetical protein